MRLTKILAGLLTAAAALWGLTGMALAATPPTVNITAASTVTTDSAALNATINPNGAGTSYHFAYGPTSALGETSAPKSLAAGTHAKHVSDTVTGLQSGTTYYYSVQAESSAGVVTTRTISFTTGGKPPAQATTGGANVTSATSVTLTGVVNPEGAATYYYFEIGTSPTYTLDTVPVNVTNISSGPQQVSVVVNGLSPYTTFHYALVATHGGVNYGTGSDETFETFPSPVPAPKVTQRTSPSAERGGPFVFRTVGSVDNTTQTPDSLACTGVATIAFYSGKHRIFRQLAPLTPTCGFAAVTTFAHLPIRGQKVEKLLVYVRFDGNGYLRAVAIKPQTVTLG